MLQGRFDAVEGLLVRAAKGVQMHAAGHPAQQTLRRAGRLLDEVVHIVPAGKVQVAAQFAVQRVLHGHVHDDPALIDHRIQLAAHLVRRAVHTGQNAGVAAGSRVELIAARGRFDLRAARPQQGHISHHDLAGNAQFRRHHAGADRRFGLAQAL